MTGTSTTDTGASRGATHTFTVTASTVAPHALTGGVVSGGRLTRPTAPTCSVAPGGGGYPATRAATVTVTGPGGQTVSALRQRWSGGQIRATASSAWTTLAHATTHYFRGQASNAAGYGPWSPDCAITTATLSGPTIAVGNVTTRGADASASAPTSGSWVENVSIAGGGSSRNDLADGAAYTVTAETTDGWNRVGGSAQFATPALTPIAPSCTISSGGQAPDGVATLSASGGHATSYEYDPARLRAGLSAGSYYGHCRSVLTDGYNTRRSGWTDRAGPVTVEQPWIHLGGTLNGRRDAQCTSAVGRGDVIDLLNGALNGVAVPSAYVESISTSGSLRPDEWQYLGGSASTGDLRCTFKREHMIRWTDDRSPAGEYVAVMVWNQGGDGAS